MSSSLDQRLVGVLADSDWVARRRDLVASGISSSTIDRRLRSGLLLSFGAGLVGLPGPPDPRRQRLRAALLTRPAGVLSHLTAAEVHGVEFERPIRRVHLTIPHGSSRAGRDLVAHQTLHLPEADVTEVDGFAVTTPARTLCDLAAGHELHPTLVADLATWMLDRELCGPGDVAACAEALGSRGRGGSSARRAMLASLFTPTAIDPDELRVRFAELVESRLPGVAIGEVPAWHRATPGVVALAVDGLRRILELDARSGKHHLHELRRDRARERSAAEHGWRVTRVGWAEVVHRPTQLHADLRHLLSREPSSRAA